MSTITVPGDGAIADQPRRKRGRPPANRDAAPQNVDTDTVQASPTPQRQEMRTEMRTEDPRTAADRRADEILQHLGDLDQGTDDFAIDRDIIPDGWTYEWKRRTIYGKEDPAYQVAIARTGWTPVPASRHPEMMPSGDSYQTIERKGMILMERPQQITDRITSIDQKRARDQVRVKEAQLGAAPDGQFSRTEDPRTRPNIKKSYVAMPIPTDK